MSSHQHAFASSDASSDPHADSAAADGLAALPSWLRGPVRSWGVTRSEESWLSGVLGGVAARYGLDPLLVRGVFAAVCLLSAGLALLAYAVAWTVLPGPDGRVLYAQLRRRDLTGAGVGVAAVGGVGLVSLLSGVGVTASLFSGGGLVGLAGLAGVGLLVWWLATRWDAQAQRPSVRAAAEDLRSRRGSSAASGSSSFASPGWYMQSRRGSRPLVSTPDEAGFHSSWIDPETGQWRDRPHSRDLRAAERVAEIEREAARERALDPRGGRPALGLLTQGAALVAAVVLSVAVMAAVGAWGVGAVNMAGPAAVVIAGGAAALVVLAPVLLVAALRGRRAPLVSGASMLSVGMVAAGVVTNVAAALV
jgi:phage shock protein PspC (stress-responsive transcriptional regulator)